jgi:HSP20 family protein
MVMSRWDPFGEALSLRDAMNRLFESAVLQPSLGDGGQRSGSEGFAPAMDVCETPDDYVVEVNLPGVKPEDVDIELHEGVLTIRGEMKQEGHAGRHTGQQTGQQSGQTNGQQSTQQQGEHRGNYGIRERRWGRFYRSVTLPANVDANKVQASFEHGVLTVTIPKAEETKPRRIQIQGQSQNRPQQIEGSASQVSGSTGQTSGSSSGR